jgi:hypothetical protein
MKNVLTLFTLTASVFFATQTFATDKIFSIEDEDLSKAIASNVDLIQMDKSFLPFKDLNCSLVEKNIALAEERGVATYLVTTAGGCGWGASMGPIWIIRKNLNEGSIVIYTGGYSVEFSPKTRHGMHDLSVYSDRLSVMYKFNGKRYVSAM